MSNSKNWLAVRCPSWVFVGLIMGLAWGTVTLPVWAQVTPPDLTVCENVTCENLPMNTCTDGGYKISLKSYTPATTQNSGSAQYVYEICSPPAGACSNDASKSCESTEQCWSNTCPLNGNNAFTCNRDGVTACATASDCNPGVTCSRECVVPSIKGLGLSHLDVVFPELGGINSCLTANTDVTGNCAVSADAAPLGVSVQSGLVLGDGSCFTATSPVAKCDNVTGFGPGDCITMTLNIAGEIEGLGKGAAVVVDKDGSTCESNCLAGPSCDRCDTPPVGGNECLTRTIGFWGTHPWITNDYDPVTICAQNTKKYELSCSGASDGKSDPSCPANGSCNSIMEGLGSNPGGELPGNQSYVSLVKQLTAAKLNLNATVALFNGATCSDFRYQGKTIQEWIDFCEYGLPDGAGGRTGGICTATAWNKSQISNSGCIEALDAFNNSQDNGSTTTPAPFDRPSVDDKGNVSGADPTQFTLAQGKTNPPGKLVVGPLGTQACK